jgi:protein TonB
MSRVRVPSSIVLSILIHVAVCVGLAPFMAYGTAVRADIVPIQLVSMPTEPAPRPVPPRAPIVPPRLVSRPVDTPQVPTTPPETVAAPEPTPAPAPLAPPSGGVGGESHSGGIAGLPSDGTGIALPAGGGNGGSVITASLGAGDGVTSFARPMGGYQRRPTYPESARRAGIEGVSTLRFQVREDGTVGAIDVERSAGANDLDRAAIAAVRMWRFEPARRGAQAVAVWVTLPVRFELKGR